MPFDVPKGRQEGVSCFFGVKEGEEEGVRGRFLTRLSGEVVIRGSWGGVVKDDWEFVWKILMWRKERGEDEKEWCGRIDKSLGLLTLLVYILNRRSVSQIQVAGSKLEGDKKGKAGNLCDLVVGVIENHWILQSL